MLEVFFDVETKKLFHEVEGRDPSLLGVSIVSTLTRIVDKNGKTGSEVIKSYWEKDFEEMWKIFMDADRIIGFNTIKFDAVALQPYTPIPLLKLPHFDILDEVRNRLGHRLSLNALAEKTLNAQKTDKGFNAVIYWNNQDLESLKKLQTYCEADVLLTRDLYDYGVQHKLLKYQDMVGRVRSFPVDFSYLDRAIKSGKQTSLF